MTIHDILFAYFTNEHGEEIAQSFSDSIEDGELKAEPIENLKLIYEDLKEIHKQKLFNSRLFAPILEYLQDLNYFLKDFYK